MQVSLETAKLMSERDTTGYIVLDTNVFGADLHGLGTSTTVLVQGVERLHHKASAVALDCQADPSERWKG
jgi:hypothetical protein